MAEIPHPERMLPEAMEHLVHGGDDLLEQRIARRPIDRLVKLPILLGRHAGAGMKRLLHGFELVADDDDISLAGAPGAKGRRLGLQGPADVQRLHQAGKVVAAGDGQRHVEHVGRHGRLQIGSAALTALDEAETLPARQRLTHRIAADFQMVGENALGRQLFPETQRFLFDKARQCGQHGIVSPCRLDG